jgi:hypothetical protein
MGDRVDGWMGEEGGHNLRIEKSYFVEFFV